MIWALLGAVWRLWDGGFKDRLPIPSNVLGVALCVTLGAWMLPWDHITMQGAAYILALTLAIPSLQRSYGGWEKWSNTLHFWPMALATLPLAFLGQWQWYLAYVGALALVGAFRPLMEKLWPSAPQWTRWAEGFEGAVVIGGLALLNL